MENLSITKIRHKTLLLIFIFAQITYSCDYTNNLPSTLELAENNRTELKKVLCHYKNDTLKLHAAKFLIDNMNTKYYYTGELYKNYDTLFHIYNSLREDGIVVGDPSIIYDTWKSLRKNYGPLKIQNLDLQLDCQNLTADFLIKNIDWAFEAWKSAPEYINKDFNTFCEFILPYRGGTEIPEEYREKYYKKFKILRDTASIDTISLLKAFNQAFYWDENYRPSEFMWNYPLDLSISQMETGRRGTCKHTGIFCALTMRACGIPIAIDHVKTWGNRSRGHTWNVLMRDSGKIFPFDPFEHTRLQFTYKPAKIFRKMYSNNCLPKEIPSFSDVPEYLLYPDELDVTHQYGETFDIEIDCDYPYQGKEKKKHGVICVFDNEKWIPVYWGINKQNKMYFKNMMPDVCYLAAYYENGKIIPASIPFILEKDGMIKKLSIHTQGRANMTLKRKYPRFARMELFAMNLRRSQVQGANEPEFKNQTLLFDVAQTPHDVNEMIVNNPRKFRYIRWKIVDYRTGDLAEVEFYGKRSLNAPEERLYEKLIGCPAVTPDQLHPFTHAMDGDPNTFFGKPKNELGYVGLDLGKGNEHYITRVRFYPRSDTNYILLGDTYELCYWENDGWKSAGIQRAGTHELTFKDVPQGTFYILHDLTKGKEERIFTYENDEQIWW